MSGLNRAARISLYASMPLSLCPPLWLCRPMARSRAQPIADDYYYSNGPSSQTRGPSFPWPSIGPCSCPFPSPCSPFALVRPSRPNPKRTQKGEPKKANPKGRTQQRTQKESSSALRIKPSSCSCLLALVTLARAPPLPLSVAHCPPWPPPAPGTGSGRGAAKDWPRLRARPMSATVASYSATAARQMLRARKQPKRLPLLAKWTHCSSFGRK